MRVFEHVAGRKNVTSGTRKDNGLNAAQILYKYINIIIIFVMYYQYTLIKIKQKHRFLFSCFSDDREEVGLLNHKSPVISNTLACGMLGWEQS